MTCLQCPRTLDAAAVQALATPEMFERYLAASLRDALSSDPDFRRCFYPTCSSGQIHEGGNIFTCVACKRKSCIECHEEWHSDKACEELQEEKAVEQAALRQWKYLKEVDKHRRSGAISDQAAAVLVNGNAANAPIQLSRSTFDEAETAATVARHSDPCPGCPARIQKTEYDKQMHSQGPALTI